MRQLVAYNVEKQRSPALLSSVETLTFRAWTPENALSTARYGMLGLYRRGVRGEVLEGRWTVR